MRTFLLSTLLFLASCAGPATVEGMTLRRSNLEQVPGGAGALAALPGLKVRSVRGGSSTSPWGSPQIANEDFESALSASLQAAGALAVQDDTSLYLDAELLSIEHPKGALDMPAHVTVRYRLLDPGREAPLYDHSLRSGYVVPARAAFTGVKRVRLAIEGAIRDNIAIMIRGLTELPPASNQR